MTKLLVTILVIGITGYTSWVGQGLWYPGSPPQLDPNEWWGPNETKHRQDTSIRPFQIKFSEEMITDLRTRLRNYRPTAPPLNGIGFEYGFNSNQLGSWAKYWANEYPFSDREKFLNQFPQYKTNIQGLDIYFIRVKPQVPPRVNVVPLLLTHGWPGSVRELFETIPLLTQQSEGFDFAFEVILPCLPGFGFSDAAVRPGLGPPQVAVIFKNLMNRLGFKKFYIQGGDWGAVIASVMSTLYPEDILGHHSNVPFVQNGYTLLRTIVGAFFPSLIVEPHLADRMYPLSEKFYFYMEELGYYHIQTTKPDTIGVSLTDSPVGLLAYILEKFSTWTDFDNRKLSDGGLSSFTKTQLIDNLMIYWSSNSITTSMRLYAESMTNANRALAYDRYPSAVPVWFLHAKTEILYQPPTILKIKYTNILGNTVLDYGGHFLALQLPNVFAADVFKAVQVFRSYHARTLKTKQ